jgi:dephospho-CoA kinase
MKKQPDFTALTDSADFVIHNEGTLTDLEQKAEALYYEIRSKK